MDNYLRFIFAIFLPIDSLYFFLGETGTLFFQTFPVSIFFGFLIILINLQKVKKILNDFRIKGFIFLFLYLSFIFFVNLLLTQSNFNLFLEKIISVGNFIWFLRTEHFELFFTVHLQTF